MTFGESIRVCLTKKYFFVFKGRACRSEFWWFMLFIGLINVGETLLIYPFSFQVQATISFAISLLLLPANLGVTVRRLHDRGMRGWWLFLPLGLLVLWVLAGGPGQAQTNILGNVISLGMVLCYLIILCMPGVKGPNKFGPDPLSALDSDPI